MHYLKVSFVLPVLLFPFLAGAYDLEQLTFSGGDHTMPRIALEGDRIFYLDDLYFTELIPGGTDVSIEVPMVDTSGWTSPASGDGRIRGNYDVSSDGSKVIYSFVNSGLQPGMVGGCSTDGSGYSLIYIWEQPVVGLPMFESVGVFGFSPDGGLFMQWENDYPPYGVIIRDASGIGQEGACSCSPEMMIGCDGCWYMSPCEYISSLSASDAVISGDNQWMAYANAGSIYVRYVVSGIAPPTLVYQGNGPGNADTDISMDHDAALIAFTRNVAGIYDILLVEVDSQAVTVIEDGPSNDRSPMLSGDGSVLVYVSDKDGDSEIYAYHTATGEREQVTDNDVYDGQPAVSIDGSLIVFSSGEPGSHRIWSASELPPTGPVRDDDWVLCGVIAGPQSTTSGLIALILPGAFALGAGFVRRRRGSAAAKS